MDDNNDPDYWKDRGNEFYKNRKYEDAIKCYIKAIGFNPEYAPAWNNLALAFRKIGKDQEAQECLNRLKNLEPETPTIDAIKKPLGPEHTSQKINPDFNNEAKVQKSGFFSFFSGLFSPVFRRDRKESSTESQVLKKAEPTVRGSPEPALDKKKFSYSTISPHPETQSIIEGDSGPANPPSRYEIAVEPLYREALKDQVSFPSKGDLIFAGLGTTLQVGKYQISNPLTYWSDGISHDASCINTQLPIGDEVWEERRAMPYYPQYSQISADQRANYLAWLAAGKKTEIYSPGYVFIYFYGLERRVMVDRKDVDIIIPEIHRLLALYSKEGSVNSYLRNFLTYICGLSLDCSEKKLMDFFTDFTSLYDGELAVVLAWYCRNEKPLPWQVAFSFGKKQCALSKTVAIKRAENELKTLFEQKYNAAYPDGLRLISSKNHYKLEYHPASPTIINYQYRNNNYTRSDYQILLPNPMGKPSQFSNIVQIYNNCVESVQLFSRKIHKSNGIINADSYCVLPQELKMLIPHPDKNNWDNLVNSHKKDNYGLVTIGDICSIMNIEMRETLTPTQSKNLVSFGRDIGYQLIPDQKILGKPYRWNDIIALYPIIDKETELSNDYYAAAMMFDLAYSVALSDAIITAEEMDHLNQNIFHSFFPLNDFDTKCLHAFQDIRKNQQESFEKLASRLKDHLTPDQRITIGKLLIEIVFSDNILTPSEQKALKKAFSSLGIETGISDTLIAEALSSRNQEKPVVIQKGVKLPKGELLPPIAPEVPRVILDLEKLIETKLNTAQVQDVLGLVFTDNEPDQICPDEHELPTEFIPDQGNVVFALELLPFPEDSIKKLESRYYPVLYEMLKTKNLSNEEFEKLVKRYGCMPQATVEEINTWADEEFDDFLIEEYNGTIIVNSQNILQ